MLILHTYRDGEEFGIFPQDISFVEVHGPVLAIAHLIRIQMPEQVIQTPQGPMKVPSRIESIIRMTEVSETIDELQMMILDLKHTENGKSTYTGPIVIPTRRITAQAMKNQEFGGEKREEPRVVEASE